MAFIDIPDEIAKKSRWIVHMTEVNGNLAFISPVTGRRTTKVRASHCGTADAAKLRVGQSNTLKLGYFLDANEYLLLIDKNDNTDEDVRKCQETIASGITERVANEQTPEYTYSERNLNKTIEQMLFTVDSDKVDRVISGQYRYGITIKGPNEFTPITGITNRAGCNRVLDRTDEINRLLGDGFLVPLSKSENDSNERVIKLSPPLDSKKRTNRIYIETKYLDTSITRDNPIVNDTDTNESNKPVMDDIPIILSKEKQIINIPINDLYKFSVVQQPFKEYTDDKFEQMVKSVQTHKILTPIIVRHKPNQEGKTYEIISGHNRVLAAEKAGLDEVPAIVEIMDDDTAIMVLVESNFKQRHDLTFSEKAHAYRLKHDIYKKQGKRNDLYGDPELRDKFVTKSMVRTSDIIGSDDNKSGRTIYRYIRLTELTDDFIATVDNGKLAFNTAVEISYLTKDEQESLYRLPDEKGIRITLRQAEALKKAKDNDEHLDAIRILEILEMAKPKESTRRGNVKLPYASISQFFDEGLTDEEITNQIIEALTKYRSEQ